MGERSLIKHRWRIGGKIRFRGVSNFASALQPDSGIIAVPLVSKAIRYATVLLNWRR